MAYPRPQAATAMLLAVACCVAPARGSDAVIEFMQRRDALKAGDTHGAFMLGVWAEDQKLPHAAAVMYHRVLGEKRDHGEAYDRLVAIADTTRLPEDAKQVERVKETFPGFRVHTSDHYLIVYDTDEAWARARASLLEKAHDVFYSTYRRMGFRPLPLKRRMVCLLFADHEQYVEYALETDRQSMGWSAGYYSTKTNRIAFYDERTSPQFKRLLARVEQLEAHTKALTEAIRLASSQRQTAVAIEHRHELNGVTRQLQFYRNQHTSISRMGNASKTVHEAVHQLAFNSGHQNPAVRYPFWFSEGLASCYEPVDPARPFGPLHPNVWRQPELDRMVKAGQLLPLSDLVRARTPPSDDIELTLRMYNQSWALYGFLFRHHRDGLKRFAERLATAEPGERTPDQLEEDFVESFGPVEGIEKRFFNYVGHKNATGWDVPPVVPALRR